MEIFHNEVDQQHGKWLVISRAESKNSSAVWLCQCNCGYRRSILGVDLRRRPPLCTNCCRKCGKTKQETKFKGNKRICRECDKDRIREWKQNNQSHKSKVRGWIARNPELIEQNRLNERQRIQSNYDIFLRYKFKDLVRKQKRSNKSLDNRSQQKAKSPKRRVITISEDMIVAFWVSQQGCCAISGMPMLHEFKNPRTVSIDRIDSALGYIPGNVQLVCCWVNLAKNSFPDEDIKTVLQEFKIL